MGDLIRNAKTLVRFRGKANLKQDELADLIGVTDQTISKWERGLTEPKMSQVSLLAKALGVDVYTLLEPNSALEKKKRCNKFISTSVSTLQEAIFNTSDENVLDCLESAINSSIDATKYLNKD